MKLHKFLITALAGTILASANGLFTLNQSTNVVNASTSNDGINKKEIIGFFSGSWYCITKGFYSKYTINNKGHYTSWLGKDKNHTTKSSGYIANPEFPHTKTWRDFYRFQNKPSGTTTAYKYLFLQLTKAKINNKKDYVMVMAPAKTKNPNPNKTDLLYYTYDPVVQSKSTY